MTDRNEPLALIREIACEAEALQLPIERAQMMRAVKTLRTALEAQAEELTQAHARIARLEGGLEIAKRDLRRATLNGPDSGHYTAFHEVCELLAEHPRQSDAAIKAEALREAADELGGEDLYRRLHNRADRIEREVKEQGDE